MKDLLGGKGAGLAEMTKRRPADSPGFTITTEACNDYFSAGKALPAGLWDDTLAAVRSSSSRRAKASAIRRTLSSSRSARAPSSRCRA